METWEELVVEKGSLLLNRSSPVVGADDEAWEKEKDRNFIHHSLNRVMKG